MKKKAFVWPWWIRFIHWSLALMIILDAFVFVEGDAPHQWLGYIALVLVLWRIYCGLKGEGPVLFKNFPISFGSLKVFAKSYRKKDHVYVGHNPAASIVYFLIWIAVIGLAVTGWMMGLDAFWGSETIEEIHEALSNSLLALTIFHLIGVFMDAFVHKRKTWMKMIRGH